MTGVFSSLEVKNIFDLFDLKREGSISKDSCKQALLTMASSQYHEEIINETDVSLTKISRLWMIK